MRRTDFLKHTKIRRHAAPRHEDLTGCSRGLEILKKALDEMWHELGLIDIRLPNNRNIARIGKDRRCARNLEAFAGKVRVFIGDEIGEFEIEDDAFHVICWNDGRAWATF